MSVVPSEIISNSNVYSTIHLGIQKKLQSSALLALGERKPLLTGGFPSQRASNLENISISWRHHVMRLDPRINSFAPGDFNEKF